MGKVISTKHVCQNTNPLSESSLYSDKHGKCIIVLCSNIYPERPPQLFFW